MIGPRDEVVGTVELHYGTGDANARLIAAAPELLEALTRIWHFADDTSHALHPDERWLYVRDEIEALARAAIAKAGGPR